MEAIQYLSFLENNQQRFSDTEKSFSYMIVSENYISVSHKKIEFNPSKEDHLDVLTDLLNGIEVTEGKIPSAILLNIPLDLKRFKEFYNSVKSINHFQKILFFWNSTLLSVSEMLYLMEAGMADDFFEDIGVDTNALRRVGVVLEEYCSSGGSCGRGGSGRENLHLELS